MQLQIVDASGSEIEVALKSSKNTIPEASVPKKVWIPQSSGGVVPTGKYNSNTDMKRTIRQDSAAIDKASTIPSASISSSLSNNTKTAAKKSPPGLVLNQLKTGQLLKGVVASTTAYAAFIDSKIFRAGKGGSFTEVNGMLHKNDISPEILSAHKKRSQSKTNGKAKGVVELLERGSEIDVYVKEVYKNSGYEIILYDKLFLGI